MFNAFVLLGLIVKNSRWNLSNVANCTVMMLLNKWKKRTHFLFKVYLQILSESETK
jgi:hypothetical protein